MKKTVLTSLSNFIVMMLLIVMTFSGCKPVVVTPQEPIGKQHKGSGKLVELYAQIGGQLYKYNEFVKPMSTYDFRMDYDGNYYYRKNENPRYNFYKNDKPLTYFNDQYELYMDSETMNFPVYNELFGVTKHDSILSFFAGGEWYKLESNEGQLDIFKLPVLNQDTIYGITKVDVNFYDIVAFPLVNNRPTQGIIRPLKLPLKTATNDYLHKLFVHNGQFSIVYGYKTLYHNNQLQQIPNEVTEILDIGWTSNNDEIILATVNIFDLVLLKNGQIWQTIDNTVCANNQRGEVDMYVHGDDIYILGANTGYVEEFQMVIWHNGTVDTLNNYSSNGGTLRSVALFPVISWE